MTSEIIIALVGIILSVLTYFAGVKRAEIRHLKEDKGKRIDDVLNRYMDFRKIARTAGWDCLLKAGASTLYSDTEIRKVADKIIAHGEKDPLGRNHYDLTNVDLKKLFDYAVNNNINFYTTSVEGVIKRSGV